MLQVIWQSASEGYTAMIGVIYDELRRLFLSLPPTTLRTRPVSGCRKEWEDRSGKLFTFKAGTETGSLSEVVLREAKAAYNRLYQDKKPQVCHIVGTLCICKCSPQSLVQATVYAQDTKR